MTTVIGAWVDGATLEGIARAPTNRPPSLVTAGDNLPGVRRFLRPGATAYSAADVIVELLSGHTCAWSAAPIQAPWGLLSRKDHHVENTRLDAIR